MEVYNKVYDFTNENVACLDYLYDFKDAKVLSIVGSGDQYFASILNGAKQVDLFDINPTSYLYFLLKFYGIRELEYDEFCDFFVRKNFDNIKVFEKLKNILPKKVLEYYKYIVSNIGESKLIFKKDGINILSKTNQKYYFETDRPVIPYLNKLTYYKLKLLLKKQNIPKFYKADLMDIKDKIKNNYDIVLLSNIYNYIELNVFEYTKFLKELNIPQIQALYDWHGFHLDEFNCLRYGLDIVRPSAPHDFALKRNFVFSLKKQEHGK